MKKLLVFFCSLMSGLAVGQNGLKTNTMANELQSFSAVCNEEKIELAWKTITGNSNVLFTVEKSKDGISFTKVVDVPGTSASYKDYAEVDYKPYKGTSYYRIKQSDKNGALSKYSTIVAVNYVPKKNITVYPNPLLVGTNLHIAVNGFENQEVVVVLRNMQGEEFVSKVLLTKEGDEVFMLDETKSLPAGRYLVMATSDNKLYNYKLLIR